MVLFLCMTNSDEPSVWDCGAVSPSALLLIPVNGNCLRSMKGDAINRLCWMKSGVPSSMLDTPDFATIRRLNYYNYLIGSFTLIAPPRSPSLAPSFL